MGVSIVTPINLRSTISCAALAGDVKKYFIFSRRNNIAAVMSDNQQKLPSRKRISVASQDSILRSSSPGRRSLRCFSSASTLDSIGFDPAPPLPAVIVVKDCTLQKKKTGWGFSLRGTRSEFGNDEGVYNCFFEAVSENGAAEVSGAR